MDDAERWFVEALLADLRIANEYLHRIANALEAANPPHVILKVPDKPFDESALTHVTPAMRRRWQDEDDQNPTR